MIFYKNQTWLITFRPQKNQLRAERSKEGFIGIFMGATPDLIPNDWKLFSIQKQNKKKTKKY